jgi:hypothetical protein
VSSASSGPTEPLLRLRRWRGRLASVEAAAVAGIVCALAWSIGIRGLLASPSVDSTPAEIARFYADPQRGFNALVLLQIILIGTVAFLWFIGVVRGRLGEVEPKLFGTVFLGGAILFAAVMLVGAAALAAPAVLVEAGGRAPDPASVSMMRALAVGLIAVFAPRVATLVVFSTAALGRVTGALPVWLVWLSYVVGVGEFVTLTVAEPTVYVFPTWIALVSLVLLIRRPGRSVQPATNGEP